MLLAEAFERETGCRLEQREVFGRPMLVPVDDRLGTFGIVVGPKPEVVFAVRSYGATIHLVVWGANEKKLDRVLRKITGAA